MTMLLALLVLSSARTSETVVAGGPKDLMIVRHLVLTGSNEEIGASLARIAVRNHKVTGDRAPSAITQRMSWFRGAYPEVLERAKGVASVLGEKAGMDPTSLSYDMDISPGCSVVFYPGSVVSNGHAMLSRNYDFPKGTYAEITHRRAPAGARSMTGDPYVIEMHPTGGLASLYICSYDLLQGAIDGVNEKGVSVALLADDMTKKRYRGTRGVGLGEIDLPRYVLDKASSAKQARQLLMKAPVYASFTPCHYIISDSTGDSFVFEIDEQDGKHIVNSNGDPQVVTNHRLSAYRAELPEGNSFDRYRRLEAEIGKRNGKFTPAQVREINLCVAVPESRRVGGTLWHSVYDLQTKTLKVSFCLSRPDESKERRTPYLDFRLD